jgi:hypothetical protein
MSDYTVNLAISYEQTRSLVIASIPQNSGGQVANLPDNVAKLAVRNGLVADPKDNDDLTPRYKLNTKYSTWVEEIFWDLIIEGVLRPSRGDGANSGLSYYHVSEYGNTVLSSQPIQPYDPDGYLITRIRTIQGLDSVILTYLEESLKAFRIHCLLSSTITLGAGSEKALLVLIEATANSFTDENKKQAFSKATENKMIKTQYDEFHKILQNEIIPALKNAKKSGDTNAKDVLENLEDFLSGVFSIIRKHRNEAGHPTGNVIEREHLYALLTVFPSYLEKVYTLIDWIKEHSK